MSVTCLCRTLTRNGTSHLGTAAAPQYQSFDSLTSGYPCFVRTRNLLQRTSLLVNSRKTYGQHSTDWQSTVVDQLVALQQADPAYCILKCCQIWVEIQSILIATASNHITAILRLVKGNPCTHQRWTKLIAFNVLLTRLWIVLQHHTLPCNRPWSEEIPRWLFFSM